MVPDSKQGRGLAYTTHCVFSTGITTMENDCCAPELLRELIELASAPEARDNKAIRVPEGGITAYSSDGNLTWTVKPRAASELAGATMAATHAAETFELGAFLPFNLTRGHMLAGGGVALRGLVVKNAHTEAELLLTRKVPTLPVEILHHSRRTIFLLISLIQCARACISRRCQSQSLQRKPHTAL